MKKNTMYLILILYISILAGCNTKIEAINPNHELVAGEEKLLEFNTNKKNIEYKDLSFISSDKDVVTVDSEGNAKAVGGGEATIIATYNDDSHCTWNFTVYDAPSLEIVEKELSLIIGETETLTYTINGGKPNEKISVIFGSGDETIVTVDEMGNITGQSKGNTEVFAFYNNTVIGKWNIQVLKPYGITAENTNIEIESGQNAKLSYKLNGKSKKLKLKFESIDASIVKVDKKGNIEALMPGKTKIKATYGDAEPVYWSVIVSEPDYWRDFILYYKQYEDSGFADPTLPLVNKIFATYFPDGCDMELYYAKIDLANDGLPELFIGDEYGSIYGVYVYDKNNSQVISLIPDADYLGDRTHCYLCANNLIRIESSGGATYNETSIWKVDKYKTELTLVDSICNYEDGFYYATLDEMDSSGTESANPATYEEYAALELKYPEMTNIQWNKLSELKISE